MYLDKKVNLFMIFPCQLNNSDSCFNYIELLCFYFHDLALSAADEAGDYDLIDHIENFERVRALGEGRCESCITPRRLEARIAELFAEGKCKTTEQMEELAEKVCGKCLSQCMGTTFDWDASAIFILLEAKPERRRRKRA
ncbi:hypothetical protein FHT87_002424 [Rhizobium sp. BK316]|uniref:hypothetical protein n=1 Tax=Rhizobium sp. BK316 TaxID=2587053 RepID=UPI00161C7CE0|nr:hypothetical protein [Rhizobium sp. BK316]MBB3408521.1 hypothetical protein [Rhizobium sp. BK316]